MSRFFLYFGLTLSYLMAMWSFTMTMDLFWFLLFDGYGYFGLFWFISLLLGLFAYVSSLYTHVFIMLFFFRVSPFLFDQCQKGEILHDCFILLLAFLLNIIILRTWNFCYFFLRHKLRGKNLGLNLKLSHKVYNLFTLHVCNHFVCHYQKGGNCWLMSQINQMFW